MNLDIFSVHTVRPFAALGLTSSFWEVNLDTLVHTWIAMAILFVLALYGKKYIAKEYNIISVVYQKAIEIFMSLTTESIKTFNFDVFAFIAAVFFFTFFNCLVGLIPYVDEATKDLNTTLALGISCFCYVQYQKIKAHGMWGYLKEFGQPIFFLAPIHIVGELAKIASLSFRLFGNILGGGVVALMFFELLGAYKVYFMSYAAIVLICHFFLSHTHAYDLHPGIKKVMSISLGLLFLASWLQMFVGIFEGLIQSFVLTMLTATYIGMGIAHDNEQEPSHTDQPQGMTP